MAQSQACSHLPTCPQSPPPPALVYRHLPFLQHPPTRGSAPRALLQLPLLPENRASLSPVAQPARVWSLSTTALSLSELPSRAFISLVLSTLSVSVLEIWACLCHLAQHSLWKLSGSFEPSADASAVSLSPPLPGMHVAPAWRPARKAVAAFPRRRVLSTLIPAARLGMQGPDALGFRAPPQLCWPVPRFWS